MDPITYPSVTLDGATYHFKVTLASLRRLREGGIEGDAPPDAQTLAATAFYGHQIAVQFAACAHVMQQDGKLKHAGITPEQAEEIIEPSDIAAIQSAITEAMVKVTPAATSPVQPAVN
jgi:hypothetical protein